MGIKPESGEHVVIPPDNVQSRWGAWQDDLDQNGEYFGEGLQETYALANSANQQVNLIPLGYCAAYMASNINNEWSGSDTRKLPFRSQLGEPNGAHIDQAGDRIVFDVTGTWTVHVLASFNGTSFSGDDGVYIEMIVRDPGGNVISSWRVRDSPGVNEGSLSCSKPVVIAAAGSTIEVVCRSGRWRWWVGGTQFSSLAVVRSALRSDNPGSSTVPDEPAP